MASAPEVKVVVAPRVDVSGFIGDLRQMALAFTELAGRLEGEAELIRGEFWNEVILGDGRRARLLPVGSLSRIVDDDGHYSCNHGDDVTCERTGHQTVITYEVVIES